MGKILVIGELCYDVFIYGECKRLSPEAPVPVLSPIDRQISKGMAGNVVIVLTEQRKELIKEADAVLVSDYNKGFLTEETLYEIGTLAKKSFLDTKKKLSADTILAYTFVKLNEEEFKKNETTDRNLLLKMIATLGGRGAKYMGTLYPVEAKETIDVSGAGDTFLAAFAIKYLQLQDVDISITFANKMCSIVVSKRGVSTP